MIKTIKANLALKKKRLGWSDEAYPVYTHPLQDSEANVAHDPIAFAIERAALPLFGLVNFGALLIGLHGLYIERREIYFIL